MESLHEQDRAIPMNLPRVAIVVPCHNEQEVLEHSAGILLARLTELVATRLASRESFLCFVDDGSSDSTWQLIVELNSRDPRVTGMKLTRNFGHQGAVLAGMLECDADAIITIDADLQDDDSCIEAMVREYLAGHDIVLGVRGERNSDTASKRTLSQGYYRLLRMLGINVHFNHADCRLMSRRAISELRQYPERNLFLRGIVPLLGLPTTTVRYARRPRKAGTSKYTPRRMVSLAWEGITSFSVAPLRLVSLLGFAIALGSLAVTLWALWVKLAQESAVPGWASTVVPMYFLGGVQILCLGVIGEYVGKIYLEAKRRPRYAVETKLASGKDTREPTKEGSHVQHPSPSTQASRHLGNE
jgi:glycosyltransferase involved in cell wall biosynthesis